MGNERLPVFIFGCLSCGKTVAGTEKCCPRCGASFENVRFECPFCGALVSPVQHRCEECGTEFSHFAEVVSQTSETGLDGTEGEESAISEPEFQEQPGEDPGETVTYECPNCGKPVKENDSECPNCGVKFGQVASRTRGAGTGN